MKKLFFLLLIFSIKAGAQNYEFFRHYKDGLDEIKYTKLIKRGSLYTTDEYRSYYGLRNNKNEIILPVLYESIWESYEPGIFIIKDSTEKTGLFNANTKAFIVPVEYHGIDGYVNGLAVVTKKNDAYDFLFGAVDTKGNFIIPFDYEYLGPYLDGLMNFKKDGKAGYIDKSNKVVIPAMYAGLSNFTNGLAPVQLESESKYGYINKQNEMVVPAEYVDAQTFHEGYSQVKRKNDSYKDANDAEMALLDSHGKLLTDFSYNFISMRQSNGLFIAKKGKKYGALDSTGKLVVSADYDNVSSHSDNFMMIKTDKKRSGLVNAKGVIVMPAEYDYISFTSGDRFYTKKGSVYTVYDTKLKTIIPSDTAEYVTMGTRKISKFKKDKALIYDINGKLLKTFDQPNLRPMGSSMFADEDSLKLMFDATIVLHNLSTHTSKTLAYTSAGDFNEEGIFMTLKDYKYDFLDHTGKKLNTKSYYSGVNFSEGVCAVQETSSGTPYLADKSFNKIKDLSTTFKGPYSEGIALSTGQYGKGLVYLDKKGNTAVTISAENGGLCKNGRIMVVNYNKYNFYDKMGNVIGNETWDNIGDFREGLSPAEKNGKWGFIDSTCNYLIQPKYSEASAFFNGIAIIKEGALYHLINKKGEKVGPDEYQGAASPGIGGFPVMKNGKVGLVNGKGETIIDFKYDNITPLTDNRAWALKNKKWGVVDNSGKEITGFIYESANEFKDGYAAAGIGKKIGLIDKNGKFIVPMEYDNLGSVYKNTVIAMRAGSEVTYSIK
jgi:hypothetical protein